MRNGGPKPISELAKHLYHDRSTCARRLEPATHKIRTKLPSSNTLVNSCCTASIPFLCAWRLPPPPTSPKNTSVWRLIYYFENEFFNAGRLMFVGTLSPHGIPQHDSPLRSKTTLDLVVVRRNSLLTPGATPEMLSAEISSLLPRWQTTDK